MREDVPNTDDDDPARKAQRERDLNLRRVFQPVPELTALFEKLLARLREVERKDD